MQTTTREETGDSVQELSDRLYGTLLTMEREMARLPATEQNRRQFAQIDTAIRLTVQITRALTTSGAMHDYAIYD